VIYKLPYILVAILILSCTSLFGADSNTVSSTVVTDKSVPTASAPSIVINNNDVCKSAAAVSVQTQVLGIATGVTITDENCERIKLARSLYGMGMKVAAVSTLCRDHRVFDAMWMSGTPCPFMGKIGDDAKSSWKKNLDVMPVASEIRIIEETKVIPAILTKPKTKVTKPIKRPSNENNKSVWARPIGVLLMLLLL
jgi:hypothetical protein|tara:strand:- start:262 stop:849 length:588 start_codon:yes stop_codon:yes gene_type:complete